jgi:hypothetical protein
MASGVLPASQQGILQELVSFPLSAAFPERAKGFCNCLQQPLCALDLGKQTIENLQSCS